MRRLRILVVSSDPHPPTRVDVSVLFGVELAKRGHEIDLILQSEAACARPYVTDWGAGRIWVGATDLGDSLLRRLKKHALSIANDCRMFSRLRHSQYDVLEVKDKFVAGALAVIACRMFRTRFIYWLSYPFPEHYLLRGKDRSARHPRLSYVRGLVYRWLLYRLLLRAAEHVFVQSEQMRQDIAAHGIAVDKMTVVPMGIDAGTFAAPPEYQRREVLPRGIPCVLYLGTLVQVRRLDFLIRAFALVKEAIPAARLYLVGRGDDPLDQKFLESEVRRLELESSVIFVGQLPRTEALQYVREADVCVSPFHPTPILQSTSPTKLIEYMAMAKAVVANDHPEQRRVIEASGGGYCVAYQEPAFAAAVVSLLQNPETARLMGERGRRYAIEHRSYRVIADIVEKRLLDLVEGRC